MKHLFKFLVPAVAVLMFAAACDKTVEIPAQPGEPEQITIKASLPESTKVAYSELENNALHLAWEANDCIRVLSGEQSQVFTIKDSFTDHEAEFTGTAIDGTSFSILYPGTYATIQEALAFDYDNHGSPELHRLPAGSRQLSGLLLHQVLGRVPRRHILCPRHCQDHCDLAERCDHR